MTLAFDALDAPDSPLARIDPRWKLAALGLAGFVAVVLRSPMLVYAAFGLALVLLLVARLPRRFAATRFATFGLFVLPFLVVLPLVSGRDGWSAAAFLTARAATLFILALVAIATAPFHRNMQAAQALGVPRVLTQITLMSYRNVYVLRDEFVRLRTALRVRGFRAGSNLRTYRTVGHVAGTLLIRGDERAERVAQAMRCRGFDGRFRSLATFQTRAAEVVFFLLLLGAAGALLAADWLLRA